MREIRVSLRRLEKLWRQQPDRPKCDFPAKIWRFFICFKMKMGWFICAFQPNYQTACAAFLRLSFVVERLVLNIHKIFILSINYRAVLITMWIFEVESWARGFTNTKRHIRADSDSRNCVYNSRLIMPEQWRTWRTVWYLISPLCIGKHSELSILAEATVRVRYRLIESFACFCVLCYQNIARKFAFW